MKVNNYKIRTSYNHLLMNSEYQGSFHCGSVKYKAKVNLEKLITCNCSMCNRAGTILAFVPKSDFQLESGEGNVTDYQFNKKVIHHLFCKTCGIKSYGWGTGPDGTKMYAVNVRCLEGVDITTLKPEMLNGKEF